jgi:peptidoglycan lytic transglycosylase
VRRFRSTLIVLLASACARESNRPIAIAPEPARGPASLHERRAAPIYPEPAHDDTALAAQFHTAPALATLEGEASYYGNSLAGHATASGEPYRPQAFTAAHKKLPLGTVLRVTRHDGTRTVYVRINDRGPYGSSRRILDLSHAAAEQLGMLRAGVLEVRAEVVAYGKTRGH